MPGTIDLNSVIAMMNQAAADTKENAAIGELKSYNNLELVKSKFKSKGKEAFDEATKPAANAKPVDPQQQVGLIQSLDSNQQNYLMQAFSIVNGGMNS